METVDVVITVEKDAFDRIKAAKSVPDMYGTDIVNAMNSIKFGEIRPAGELQFNYDSVNDDMLATYFCSNCNAGAYGLDNFCHNCGAKLHKEGSDNG